MDESALEHFRRLGYLKVSGLFDPARDFTALRNEYREKVDGLVDQQFRCGRVGKHLLTAPFEEKVLALFSALGGELHASLDISLPQRNVTADTPVHNGRAVFDILTHPPLLDAVERFIGAEILSNPTQHVRIKPPASLIDNAPTVTGEVATTVWHQDLGTVSAEADHSRILTVWIAVTEATKENGCLLVAPGSHRRGLVVHEHDRRANYSRQAIPDDVVGEERVAIEASAGDVVFLDRLMMHASLPNRSRHLRWSMDLRYQPIGEPTGRPWFPSFVARSRESPNSVLTDPKEWAARWRAAREQLIANPPKSFQRWPST
ncbi:MAG: phytanoyl-CoA dioxygenase family protein [Pseudomonadota bacterium]